MSLAEQPITQRIGCVALTPSRDNDADQGDCHGQIQSRTFRRLRSGCAYGSAPRTGIGASLPSRLAGFRLGGTGSRGGRRRRHDRDRAGPRPGCTVLSATGLLSPGAGLLRPAARFLRGASGLLRALSEDERAAAPPSRRGGRPSREAAALLGEHILEVATELFFAQGYGVTTIEAVAQRARIAKRTFYHRFPDKAALFGAVVRRIIEALQPPADTPIYDDGSLEEVLRCLARLILRAALTPMALSLHRLIVAEAKRFPDLAAIVAREGGRAELVGQIAALLEREARAGSLAITRPEFAAEQFLQFVVASPQRRALGLGTPMTEAELELWADDCVNLFLNGCRSWQPPAR